MASQFSLQPYNSVSYVDVVALQLGLQRLPAEPADTFLDRLYQAASNVREIALGMGTTRHSLFVPLPSASFSYSLFVGVANLGFTGQYGVGLSGSYTVNNFRAALNLAPDGNTVSPGQVYAQVWNNTGGSQGPVLANITAVAWRVGA